jgi:hypothetical protein
MKVFRCSRVSDLSKRSVSIAASLVFASHGESAKLPIHAHAPDHNPVNACPKDQEHDQDHEHERKRMTSSTADATF